MDCDKAFREIDRVRSVSGMRSRLLALDPGLRKAVVLQALGKSRHQFVWSWLAQLSGVPEQEWPEKPQGMR